MDFQERNPGVTLSRKIAGDFSLCVTLFFSGELQFKRQFQGYFLVSLLRINSLCKNFKTASQN